MSDKFKCAKCRKHKTREHFHRDRNRPAGVQRYCKECKRINDRGGVIKKFIVYYLPKENYVGMTNNFKRRLNRHTENKKNIKGARVLIKTRHVKLAHLLETVLHMLGFNGFRY